MSRYKVVRELGHNREGGRITYLATDTSLDPPQDVVIKEFRFAASGADWSGFKAYQREIEMLRELKHDRIPYYLDSFETKSGFCLVQEYKNAPSLAERRSFSPKEIKQIAVSVLEILVYLQQRTPPVIHRDIKPENILVDKGGQGGTAPTAYLVDFGFARIRGGELALSSVAAGTPGFMPPEEQFGRTLTEASDLYSLGATLICLLTGTRSVDVGKLIDDDYRFDFKGKVPQLSPDFISWLEKMVAPNVKQRFDNAAVALEALKPIRVVGGATRLKIPVGAIKRRKPATVLMLVAAIAVIAGIYRTLMISWQASPVRQLLATKQCPGCNLREANLGGANLDGANLARADLLGANLGGTDLLLANLAGANLGRAYLIFAHLGSAKLQGAKLQGAKLQGADLQGADLEGANLEGANLEGANLKNARLLLAYLEDSNLEGANLEGAFLGGAFLEGANLRGAYLAGANLKGAHLEGVNLKSADLKGAIMPDGSKHP
jgi:hypothetical protein